MRNIFFFGDHNSMLAGLTIEKRPSPAIPKRRKTVYRVGGRNDDLYEDEGCYENVLLAYQVGCSNIDDCLDYLKAMLHQPGYQKLKDTYDNTGYRRAYVEDPGQFTEDLLNFGHATITFSADPFFYLNSGETATNISKTSTTYLSNPEPNFFALPLIVANGTAGNAVTLTIANKNYKFKIPTGGKITIDCLNETAYTNTKNACSSLEFDEFPKLPAAQSIACSFTGGGSGRTLTITPRWRKI